MPATEEFLCIPLVSPSGDAHTLELYPSETVSQMKALLANRLHISDDVDIDIYLGCRKLEDDCALQSLSDNLSVSTLSFVLVSDRRMRLLRSRIQRDWVDADVAEHALGVALGLFPESTTMPDYKWMFWTNNSVGNWLFQSLERLARESGVLEQNDLDWSQFRICQDASGPLLDILGESPQTLSRFVDLIPQREHTAAAEA